MTQVSHPNDNDDFDCIDTYDESHDPPAHALLPDEELARIAEDATHQVSLRDIGPNPWNPHKMTGDEMAALIESIREDGQWRPILVVEMDTPDEYDQEILSKYRIVDGEHAYHALCALAFEGGSPTARIMVLGKNSQIPVWKQQLIGQTMNHGMRGSQEDSAKTREVLTEILRHRSSDYIARRIGLGIAGVNQLAGARVPGRPGSKSTGLAAGVASTPYVERKAYVTALSFSDAASQARFDELMLAVGNIVPLDHDDYAGRRGQYRVDTLMLALEAFVQENA